MNFYSIINTLGKRNKKLTEQDSASSPKNKSTQLPETYHFIFFPFLCVTFVLIYYITRRKPIHRGVKYGHHHAAGQPLLFSKPIQITVADLQQKTFTQHLSINHCCGSSCETLTSFLAKDSSYSVIVTSYTDYIVFLPIHDRKY